MLTYFFNKILFKNKSYQTNHERFDLIYDNYINVLKKIINLSKANNTKIVFVIQSTGIDNNKNKYLTSFSQKAKEQIHNLEQ